MVVFIHRTQSDLKNSVNTGCFVAIFMSVEVTGHRKSAFLPIPGPNIVIAFWIPLSAGELERLRPWRTLLHVSMKATTLSLSPQSPPSGVRGHVVRVCLCSVLPAR